MLPIQITVGAGGLNPSAGSTEYNNPALAGITGYVDRSGYGVWDFNNYQILSTGGFRLLNGYTFEASAVYTFIPVGAYYDSSLNTGYTNGFHHGKAMAALFGRVGWMQEPGQLTLDSTNLTARSGRKFNDGSFHTLVTAKNLLDTMQLPAATETQFNAYLTAYQRAIILRSLNGVFSEPEFISQSLLYDRWSYNDRPIENSGKFVGVQIKIPSKVDLATQIDSVSLYFDGVETFNIYVFNDVKLNPIYTKEVTTVANTQTTVDLTDFVLNYVGGDNHGGIFYIGYFQDDLGSVKAIEERDISFKCNAPYGAVPIEAAATGSTAFDRFNISYSLKAYGINPHISVFRDHTWQILKKPSLFDNLIGLQCAAQTIESIMYSTRSNGTERVLKDTATQMQAGLELNGVAPITQGPYTTGIRKQIEQEIKRVKKSFQPEARSMVVNIC